MSVPNEVLKYVSSDGVVGGSGLLVDRAKHLSQIAQLTMDSGLRISPFGIDANNLNIKNVNELHVEKIVAAQVVTLSQEPSREPAPQPAPPPIVAEFPDDMVVESIETSQCTTSTLLIPPLSGAAYLGTDNTGRIIRVAAPAVPLSQNQPAPIAAAPLPPLPDLSKYVTSPVSGVADTLPRYVGPQIITSSSVKLDHAGNVGGIEKLDCLQLSVADTIEADTINALNVAGKNGIFEKLNYSKIFQASVMTKSLYISNGAFQPIDVGGEGIYEGNLQVSAYSLWFSLHVGRTPTIFRSSFVGGIGGAKSTQQEEHESDNGYDFMLITLPDVGKIALGVEQKTGEICMRSDQNELLSVTLFIKKIGLMAA